MFVKGSNMIVLYNCTGQVFCHMWFTNTTYHHQRVCSVTKVLIFTEFEFNNYLTDHAFSVMFKREPFNKL